ncbi:MAG: MFS transporter [Deltaproteobacteria bacterium]|nr:MFS transporter [Deltaproteobacteria bacterium]
MQQSEHPPCPPFSKGGHDPNGEAIHYAWWILGASIVIELFGLGFGIFAITTVYPYIIEAFPDWSRKMVFLPTSLIILVVGVLSPVIGWALDRFSIRRVFILGIVLQGTALYLFSHVQTASQYLGAALLLGIGMSGVTILPNQVLVSRWFHARVGLVNGVILAATALGAAIAPALITRLIEALDWRSAFVVLAALASLPPLLVVLLIVRDSPASAGLAPYGAGTVVAARAAGGLTLREAIAFPAFWVFAGAIFLGGMPCYAYNKHILVFLGELGYGKVEAADYKSLFFLVSACGRVAFGWLADRSDRRNLLLLQIVLIAVGYPLLFLVPTHPQILVPALVLFGAGYGGLLPSVPILTVHFFGRAHLGTLLGAYKVVYDVAAASAPLFVAALYDHYGAYTVPQIWLTVFAWLAVLLVVFGLPHRLPERTAPVALSQPAA